MTLFFSLCCFSICFTPSLMLFKRVVVSDPLRIILFVLGAFFWLLSLLVTSSIWFLIWLISSDSSPVFACFFSILFQESARALYYFLLYKAQGGLTKLATDGVDVSGIRLMYSSRHVLAIVCGLGMGVMAALFLLTNILADYSKDGVVGLPAALSGKNETLQLYAADAYFPLYYSLSCGLLTMHNVVWTITMWDGMHRFFHKFGGFWPVSVALTLAFHVANTTLSIWLRESPIPILVGQAAVLLAAMLHSAVLIKNVDLVGGIQRKLGRQQPTPLQQQQEEERE